MTDVKRLRNSQNRATRGAIFPHWCEYEGPQWEGARRCAHCGGLLRHVTDTGLDHGPAEGIVTETGLALAMSSNGHSQPGSTRMERRATELRDIGALRFLARLHDRTGGSSVAAHCRDLANIFAESAACKATPWPETGATVPEGATYGPSLGEAYHRPTDLYVDVLARLEDGTVLFRSPAYGEDRCAPNFLNVTDADSLAAHTLATAL